MRVTLKVASVFTAFLVVMAFLGTGALADGNILKRGSKGSDVKELQELLQEQGYFNYDKITCYYGKITEDAVKAFQKANNLKADGIVGDKTWAIIKGNNSTQSADDGNDSQTQSYKSASFSTISEGMEGEEVEKIQRRLQELGLYSYSRITGYYGSITEDAVEAFQKAYGLKVDGVIGAKTMEVLFTEYKETSLIPGMQSDEVVSLQKRLKELGYYDYSADGEYGPKTREAVVYFQSAHGLTSDGVAGTQTKQLLYSSAAMTEQEARRKLTEEYDKEDDEEQAQAQEQESPTQSDEGKTNAERVIEIAKSKLGAPYVYAADGPDSFDCSGFTSYVMAQLGISIPRTAYDQGYEQYGVKITDRDNLLPGDLVFFNTNSSDGDLSDHSGIYLGNGDFIHANSGSGKSVVISNMNTSSFYNAAFSWGRRVLD